MKALYNWLFCFALVGFSSLPAQATGNLSVDLSMFYLSKTKASENDAGATTKAELSDQFVHGGACYFFSSSICIGLKYISYEQETTSSFQSSSGSSSSETTSTDKWTGAGVSVGFQNDAINARASYIFDGKYTNGTTDFYGGTSYQVDLGYGFKVKSTMVGPMLSYSNFGYTKKKTGSVESTLNNDLSDEWITPSLAIWLAL